MRKMFSFVNFFFSITFNSQQVHSSWNFKLTSKSATNIIIFLHFHRRFAQGLKEFFPTGVEAFSVLFSSYSLDS